MSDEQGCPKDGRVPAGPLTATTKETANPGLRKYLMATGAVLMVGTLLVNWAADPPGYCREQQRYIGDKEFILAVIPVVRKDIARDSGAFMGDASSSFYAYWNHYIPELGDTSCCKVNRQETHSLVNRLFGWQSIEVLIAPPGKRGEKMRGLSWSDAVSFYFDVCGVLVDSDIGVRSGRPPQGERITTTRVDGE